MIKDEKKKRLLCVLLFLLLLFQCSVDPTCLNPDAEVWPSSHLTVDTSGPAYLQSEQLWTHFPDLLTEPEGNIVLRFLYTQLVLQLQSTAGVGVQAWCLSLTLRVPC